MILFNVWQSISRGNKLVTQVISGDHFGFGSSQHERHRIEHDVARDCRAAPSQGDVENDHVFRVWINPLIGVHGVSVRQLDSIAKRWPRDRRQAVRFTQGPERKPESEGDASLTDGMALVFHRKICVYRQRANFAGEVVTMVITELI